MPFFTHFATPCVEKRAIWHNKLGRLIRENNPHEDIDKTVVWCYDISGNILSRTEYDYTTGDLTSVAPTATFAYTYGSNWKDQLVSFNGQSIAYDQAGNPTSYKGMALGWSRGRLLTSATMGGKTIAMQYDANGIRTRKLNTESPFQTKVDYTYSGNKLVRERTALGSQGNFYLTNHRTYLYNSQGVMGFVQDGAEYIYHKNIFGDIVAIYQGSTKVAEYIYDAWGNHKVLDGNSVEVADPAHIAHQNPFRYRGYYFDIDLQLYYIQGRYYDPQTGRFIKVDSFESLDPETIGGLNLYAYCGNNPVNYKQRPVSSGSSITDSSLSETLGVGFMPIINLSGGGSSIFNSVLANGSFRNGLIFGKGTITGLYASGDAIAQIDLKNGKFVLGAYGSFSLLNATGQIGIGNDDCRVSLVGVGDIGKVSATAGIFIDPSKNTYFVGIEAEAAVFTASGGVV